MNKKIGRNDLCPCGSGKKYKNVVLNKDLDTDVGADIALDYQNKSPHPRLKS